MQGQNKAMVNAMVDVAVGLICRSFSPFDSTHIQIGNNRFDQVFKTMIKLVFITVFVFIGNMECLSQPILTGVLQGQAPFCQGDSSTFTIAPATGSGPVQYIWWLSHPAAASSSSDTTTLPTNTFHWTSIVTGTIKVYVKACDSVGCSDSMFVNVPLSNTPNPPVFSPSSAYNANQCASIPVHFIIDQPSFNLYDYYWDFGDGAGWQQATSSQIQHVYEAIGAAGNIDFLVYLKAENNGCKDSTSQIITRKKSPGLTLTDQDSQSPWHDCFVVGASTLTMVNSYPQPNSIDSYIIDWGDGTIETIQGYFNTASHDYLNDGVYHIVVEVFNQFCSSTATADFFKGNTVDVSVPTVNLGFYCAPHDFLFELDNFQNNPEGSIYKIWFGDSLVPPDPIELGDECDLQLEQSELEADSGKIQHTYKHHSCDAPNFGFKFKIWVSNGCHQGEAQLAYFTVGELPEAAFESDTLICTGEELTVFNNSTPSCFPLSSQTTDTFTIYWGDGSNPNVSTSTAPQGHIYQTEGNYTVTMIASTNAPSFYPCVNQVDSFTINVCVEDTVIPVFNWDTTKVYCVDDTVKLINESDSSYCSSEVNFYWQILGNPYNWSWATGSNSNSFEPEILFNNPGEYIIRCTAISCANATKTDTIYISRAPLISALDTLSFCGAQDSLLLEVSYFNFRDSLEYTWTLPDGVDTIPPSTTHDSVPLLFFNDSPEVDEYLLHLMAENTCGFANDSILVVINPIPDLSITLNSNSTICGGDTVDIEFASSTPDAGFYWDIPGYDTLSPMGIFTNPTAGIDSVILQPIFNSASDPIDVYFRCQSFFVSPLSGDTCYGEIDSVMVTVNPAPLVNIDPMPPYSRICSGDSIYYILSSPNPLTTFNWEVIGNLPTGVSMSQEFAYDSIVDPSCINQTNDTVSITILATPSISGNTCEPNTREIEVIVFPEPVIDSIVQTHDDIICSGMDVNYGFYTSTEHTQFHWNVLSPQDMNLINGITMSGTDTIDFTVENLRDSSVVIEIEVGTMLVFDGDTCYGETDSISFTVNPIPIVNIDPMPPFSQICSGESIFYTLSSPKLNTTFYWQVLDNYPAGLSVSQEFAYDSIVDPSFINQSNDIVNITIRAIPSIAGNQCTPIIEEIDVVVLPEPVIDSIVQIHDDTICSNMNVNYGFYTSTQHTQFHWNVVSPQDMNLINGITMSGTDTIDFTVENLRDTSVQVEIEVSTILVFNGDTCLGEDTTVSFVIQPALVFGHPSFTTLDTSLCSGDSIHFDFDSDAENVIYTLEETGSNNYGFSISPQGEIHEKMVNNSDETQQYSFTVKLELDSCESETLKTVNILVYPVPHLFIDTDSLIAYDTICSGDTIDHLLSSNVSNGVDYFWNSNFTPPAPTSFNNSDNSSSINQLFYNFTNSPFDLYYDINTSIAGCPGDTGRLYVHLNQAPGFSLDTIALCSGDTLFFSPDSLVSTPLSSFSWETSYPAGIQTTYPNSGTTNIESCVLENNSTDPMVINYNFTMHTNTGGCEGVSTLYVEVHPSAEMDPIGNIEICSGDAVNLSFPKNTSGLEYNWNHSLGLNMTCSNPGSVAQDTMIVEALDLSNNIDTPVVSQYTFYVDVVDPTLGCVGGSTTTSVTVYPNPVVSAFSSDNQIHNTSWVDPLTSSVTNGTSPFTYNWTPVTSLSTPENQPNVSTVPLSDSMEFSLTVSDSMGCIDSDTTLVRIDPNSFLSVSIHGDDCICYGDSISLFTSVTNANGNIYYEWSNSATSDSIAEAPESDLTYYLTITDGYDTAYANYTVAVHPLPSFVWSTDTSYCAGFGGADVILQNSEPGVTYYIYDYNGAFIDSTLSQGTSVLFDSITAGQYYFYAQYDSCNNGTYCFSYFDTITVFEQPTPVIDISGFQGTTGSAGPFGPPWVDTLQVNVQNAGTTPYNFSWAPNGSIASYYPNNSTIITDILNDSTQFQTIITDEYDCSDTAFFDILLDPNIGLVVDINSDTGTCICFGESITLTAIATGGGSPYSYLWSPNGETTESIDVSPNTTESYSVAVTEFPQPNTVTATFNVNVHLLPTEVLYYDADFCDGINGVDIPISNTQPGKTYILNNISNTDQYAVTTNNGNLLFPNILEGEYFVYAEYSPCGGTITCTNSFDTIEVIRNPKPIASISGTTVPHGPPWHEDLTANVMAGTTPYSYNWQPIDSIQIINTSQVITTMPLNSTTTFDLYVDDVNGCKDTALHTVEIDTSLTLKVLINFGTDTCICNGETITLKARPKNGESPYSFLWTGGETTNTITVTPDFGYSFMAQSVEYSVTVTDAIGNTDIDNYSATVHPLPLNVNFGNYLEYCEGTDGVDVIITGTQPGKTYTLGTDVQTATSSSLTFHKYGNPAPSFGPIIYDLSVEYQPCTPQGNGVCYRYLGEIEVNHNRNPFEPETNCTPNSYADGSPLGANITMNFHQTDINYYLIDNTLNPTDSIIGNNNTLVFDTVMAGYYFIQAIDPATGCTSITEDSCEIIMNPLPQSFQVFGQGCLCNGDSGIVVSLSGSQNGGTIVYELYRDGLFTGDTLYGTGNQLNFPPQTQSGAYTVLATNIFSGVSNPMQDSAFVNQYPTPYPYFLFNGYGGMCQDDATLYIEDSEAGIYYQLMLENAPYGPPALGTDSIITFNDIAGMPQLWDTGTYTVVAIDSSLCTSPYGNNTPIVCKSLMLGSVVIHPIPLAFNLVSDDICEGDSVVLLSSEPNTEYILYQDSIITSNPIMQQISGTGNALVFGSFENEGSYYVEAINQFGCTNTMLNTIQVHPNPQVFTMLGNPSNYDCAPIEISLMNSEPGILYRLIKDHSYPPIMTMTGNGNQLNFGSYIEEGVYTIEALDSIPPPYCYSQMDDSVVIFHSPQAQIMTPNQINCVPSQGPVSIGLADTEAEVTYVLLLNGSYFDTIPGTGNSVTFGQYNYEGEYTAIGVDDSTGCITDMIGLIFIYPSPNIYNIIDSLGNTCPSLLCQGSHIMLDSSQIDVTYQLYRYSTPYGNPIPGTGLPLDFGAISTTGNYTIYGYYTIQGSNLNYCPVEMNCSTQVVTSPIQYQLSCCPSDTANPCSISSCCICEGQAPSLTISLDSSQAGVSYHLYHNNIATGDSVNGSGGSISWPISTPGYYTVLGRIYNPPTCTAWMTGNIYIEEDPAPTVFAGNDSIVCTSILEFILNQSDADNYSNIEWSSSGTGSFNNVNNLHATYTPSALDKSSGSVTLTVCADGLNCCSQISICDEIVLLFDQPSASIIPSQLSIGECNNPAQTINLNSSTTGYSPYLFNWTSSQGNIITSPNSNQTAITFYNTGQNSHSIFLHVIDSMGCSAYDTIDIAVEEINLSISSANGIQNGTNYAIGTCNQTCLLTALTNQGNTINSYQWSTTNVGDLSNTNQSSTIFSSIISGTYPVELNITDVYGCQDSSLITITVDTLVIDAFGTTAACGPTSGTVDDTLTIGTCCEVELDAGIQVGTAPFSYLWETSPSCTGCLVGGSTATNPVFAPPAAGNYEIYVAVTDLYGCTKKDTIWVNVDQLPDLLTQFTPDDSPGNSSTWIDYNGSNPIDVGSCWVDQDWNNNAAKLRILTTNGIAPFSYQWNQVSPATPPTCNNPGSSQEIDFWNCAVNTPTSYVYNVTVSDAYSCTTTADLALNVVALPVVTTEVLGSCPGSTNAISSTEIVIGNCCSATLNGSWDVGNAQVQWEPSNFLSPIICDFSLPVQSNCKEFNPVSQGTFPYTFTVTDEFGCSSSSSLTITVDTLEIDAFGTTAACGPTSGTVDDTLTIGTCCEVELDAGIQVGTTPFTYLWETSPPCAGCLVGGNTATNPVFDPPAAGNYEIYVTVTDLYGCTKKDTIWVNVDQLPDLLTQFTPDDSPGNSSTWIDYNGSTPIEVGRCWADQDWYNNPAKLRVVTSGGIPNFSYQWNQVSPTNPSPCNNPGSGQEIDFWNCAVNTPTSYVYNVTVSDAYSCTTTADLALNVVAPPVVTTEVLGSCPGSVNAISSTEIVIGNCCSATLNGSWDVGNAQVQWEPSNFLSPTICDFSLPAQSSCMEFNPVSQGTFPYTFTVTDEFGCKDSSSVSITVDTLVIDAFGTATACGPTSGTVGDTLTIGTCCEVELDAGIQVGTPPFSYLWETSPPCTGCLVGGNTATNPVFDPPAAGNYEIYVTVTDLYGCTKKDTVWVNIDPLPLLQTQFLPDNSPSNSATWIDYNGVDPIDVGSCWVDQDWFNNPAKLRVLTPGGTSPYSFFWTQTTPPWPTCIDANNTNEVNFYNCFPGGFANYIFSISVTDTYGCTDISEISLQITPAPSVIANISTDCPSNSVLGVSSVDVGYCCSTSLVGTGFPDSTSIHWVSSPYLSPSSCPIGVLQNSNCQTFNPIEEGDYPFDFVVTDMFGCTDTGSVIAHVDTLHVEATGQAIDNNGNLVGLANDTLTIGSCWSVQLDSGIVSGVGPFTYSWEVFPTCSACFNGNALSTIGDPVFNPPSSGTYKILLTVTDYYGCTVESPLIINVAPLPDLKIEFKPDDNPCNSNMICGSNTQWCHNTYPVPIEVSSCCMDISGMPASILVHANNGTSPYNYSWSPIGGCIVSATNQELIDIYHCTGNPSEIYTYSVIVEDDYGCPSYDSISIQVDQPMVDASISTNCIPPEPFIYSGSETDTTCTSCFTQFCASASPVGLSPYFYQWSCSSILNSAYIECPTVTAHENGLYSCNVVATDKFGCESVPDTVLLTLVDPIIDSITTLPNKTVFCDGDSIILTGHVTADNPTYFWTWPGGNSYGNNINIGVLPNGTHAICLSVTDVHGCVKDTCIDIEIQYSSPQVDWSFYATGLSIPFTDICEIDATAGVQAVVSLSGNSPYLFSNINSSCGNNEVALPTGSPSIWETAFHTPMGILPFDITECIYSLTVTDVHGCEVESQDTIKIWPTPNVVFNSNSVEVCPGDNAILEVLIDGTPSPFPSPPCDVYVTYSLLSNPNTTYSTSCPIGGIPCPCVCEITVPNVTIAETVTLLEIGYDCTGPGINLLCEGNAPTVGNTCTIELSPEPIFDIVGDLGFCVGQSDPVCFDVVVDPTTGSSGNWDFDITPGLAIISPMPNTSFSSVFTICIDPASITAGTTYTIELTDDFGNGCSWEEDLDFTEHELPDVALLSSSPQNICEGDCSTISITLSGIGPWEVVFDDGLSLDSVILPTNAMTPVMGPYTGEFSVCPQAIGLHHFEIVRIRGQYCANSTPSQSTFDINVFGMPDADIGLSCDGNTYSELDVCNSSTYDLEVELTGEPPWIVTISRNGILEDIPVAPVAPFAIPYLHTISENCIDNMQIEIISVQDNPTFDLSCTRTYIDKKVRVNCISAPTAKFCCSDSEICEGETAELCLNLTGDQFCQGSGYDWEIQFTDGTNPTTVGLSAASQPEDFVIQVEPTQTTSYTLLSVEYMDACGDCQCIGEIIGGPITVNVNPTPEVSVVFSPSSITQGEKTNVVVSLLIGTPPFSVYCDNKVYTSNENKFNIPFEYPESLIEEIDTFFHIQKIVDANGCVCVGDISGSLTIGLDPNRECIIKVPDAFTPNGDGINDFIAPVGDVEQLASLKFYIYNRFGNLVYFADKKSLDLGWDGKDNKGNLMLPDTYSYYLEYECFENDKNDPITGVITLISK